MKLSIIIPVYNEQKTIAEILNRVNKVELPGITKEIIIINDGSTDESNNIIKKEIARIKNIKYYSQKENLGKGAGIKKGISLAEGKYIIIQDADLEYDPQNYINLLKPVIEKKSVVVYGSRLRRLPDFSKDERTIRFFLHYIGNKFLSLITSALYGQWITDMETCYKLFPKQAVDGINLKSKGFDFEPEITAKLLKRGYKIYEIPISTNPRGYDEGKKLNTFKDGIRALGALIKYRFSD